MFLMCRRNLFITLISKVAGLLMQKNEEYLIQTCWRAEEPVLESYHWNTSFTEQETADLFQK